jgi:hypothetical protein
MHYLSNSFVAMNIVIGCNLSLKPSSFFIIPPFSTECNYVTLTDSLTLLCGLLRHSPFCHSQQPLESNKSTLTNPTGICVCRLVFASSKVRNSKFLIQGQVLGRLGFNSGSSTCVSELYGNSNAFHACYQAEFWR